MNTLLLPVSNLCSIKYYSTVKLNSTNRFRCKSFNVDASSNEVDTKTVVNNNDNNGNNGNNEDESVGVTNKNSSGATPSVEKDLKKALEHAVVPVEASIDESNMGVLEGLEQAVW
ncbi:hypothetical protein Tco_0474518 [Tanacetum coccineum]